ncbi:glycosyltransferase family 9 protein [Candidatus Pelagibacter bacterium nBUS_25]|uniref:glycosyltransferase family 9 protein n=1 Tax=Candidatus Pelagibacter bacterium nBUS_25 TaxID=3374187 RepID=UPI003EBF4FB7
MKTGIYLSYVGLGANLLHLSYCHQIAKKNGPVTIITLCKNLEAALLDDPLIEKVLYINKYHKKLIDIFKLGKILKKLDFENLLIFYPSMRLYLAAKLAGIKNVFIYNFFKKKRLHLVSAAKKLTESFLNLDNCPTETKFFVNQERINKIYNEFDHNKFKIVIGAGSSGPTTRWGSKNFSDLINQLNVLDEYLFFILCGPNEKEIESEIVSNLKKKNYITLSNKSIYDVIPYLYLSDMYVGNDSFGSHIMCQFGKKSIVMLLDAPKAYTDYSQNYHRVIPNGYKIDEITHGTNADPNLITVDEVIKTINHLKN